MNNNSIMCPFKDFEGNYSAIDNPIEVTNSTSVHIGLNIEDTLKRTIHNQLQKKIDYYDRLGFEYLAKADSDGFLYEVLTKEEIDNSRAKEPHTECENIEIWHGKKVSGDYYFPMPTYCLKDKKFSARIFGALMVLSNSGGKELMSFENDRYIYDNSFNTTQLAKDLGIGRTTLERNIKKLQSLDYKVVEVENTKNGIVYRLNYGVQSETNPNEVNKYVTINQKMLKNLVCSFKDNVIKLYCLMNYMCDTKSYTRISRAWLCEQIGLEPNPKNKMQITTIMTDLELCGYIESKRIQEFVWNEELQKKEPRTPKVYRLRSLEEWEEIRNAIKNKPIESK